MNSTALQFNRFGFKPETRYKGFLGLVAHEYFHNYNVKRIRPDALGPFDYENENYTRLLWVAEGGTEYYSGLLLVRAGLITDKEFLEAKARAIGGTALVLLALEVRYVPGLRLIDGRRYAARFRSDDEVPSTAAGRLPAGPAGPSGGAPGGGSPEGPPTPGAD